MTVERWIPNELVDEVRRRAQAEGVDPAVWVTAVVEAGLARPTPGAQADAPAVEPDAAGVAADPTDTDGPRPGTFQVDLRGVVDLLSHHLYSGPAVYVRELLQNAVDAITARRLLDPTHAGAIRLEISGEAHPTLVVEDDGIGLTPDEVTDLLATIGRSSKRDELSFNRRDFIGQFGVGLLSAFLVADEAVVVSTSARDADAPSVEWRGRADGTFDVRVLAERQSPGTTVYLQARPDMAEWVTVERVVALADRYGRHLAVPIVVHGGTEPRRIEQPFPWERTADPRELLRQGEAIFGVPLLDVVPIEASVAGARGLAFVLAESPGPHQRPVHRVHLKRMLLSDRSDKLLPDWAFFVACIIDAEELQPTASREDLQDGEGLHLTRDALGDALRRAMVAMAADEPERLRAWIGVHHLAMKALAAVDDEFLAVVANWLPFETTLGRTDLTEIASATDTLHVARTVETFRQVAPVAGAMGMVVANGGYTYDTNVLLRVPLVRADLTVREVEADALLARFGDLDADDRRLAAPLVRRAEKVLSGFEVEPLVRRFEPWSLPALFVATDDDRYLRQLHASADGASPLFGGILDNIAAASGARGPSVCFNLENPLVRRLCDAVDGDVTDRVVELLFVQSLLLGHHAMSTGELGLLNGSLLGLLSWTVDRLDPPAATGDDAIGDDDATDDDATDDEGSDDRGAEA